MAGISDRPVVDVVLAEDEQLEPEPEHVQHGALLSGRGARAEPSRGPRGRLYKEGCWVGAFGGVNSLRLLLPRPVFLYDSFFRHGGAHRKSINKAERAFLLLRVGQLRMSGVGLIFLLAAIVAAVIAFVKHRSSSRSRITPDDVVEFSVRCDLISRDRSRTGLQKNHDVAGLWGKFAGRRVRWAGNVYDVKSADSGIEVIVTVHVEREPGFLMVFLEYPSEARSKLFSYRVEQEIWLDATIPKDGISELQRAAEGVIHLPGRIAPK